MILDLLRQRTSLLHDRVERAVDLPSRCDSREGYASLLSRLLGFYEPFETALARFDWRQAGLDFEERRKAGRLRADLSALGWEGAAIDGAARCRDLPRPAALAGAVGCLYVLEGATLGGQVIARQTARSLGVGPERGGRFYEGYGEATGRLWRAFGSAANAYCGHDERRSEEAVDGAIATFAAFEAWLAPAR